MIVVRVIAVRVELIMSWRNRQISEIEQNRLVRFIRRMKIRIRSEICNILRGTAQTVGMNAIRGNCNYTAIVNIPAKLRCQMRNDSVEQGRVIGKSLFDLRATTIRKMERNGKEEEHTE
jgi:hypothetical protein